MSNHEPVSSGAEAPAAVKGLLFLVCFAMFVAGIWAFGEGVSQESPWFFSAGLLATGLAFLLPIHARQD